VEWKGCGWLSEKKETTLRFSLFLSLQLNHSTLGTESTVVTWDLTEGCQEEGGV